MTEHIDTEEGKRRERAFHIRCEAEEMVARNPRWLEHYGEENRAISEAMVVAERAYDERQTRGT